MSKDKPKAKKDSLIASNKKAFHDYEVLETIMCGIVLTGTEIKSIRNGKVSIKDSFARIENGEVTLYGLFISPYEQGSYNNHEPERPRRLLLTKQEINKLVNKLKGSGYTLVPLKLFFQRAWVKVNIGVCKGKKVHDKRSAIMDRTIKRDVDRALKSRQ